VTNTGSNSISAFTIADTGNATPTFTISGTNTTLDQPEGIAADPSGVLITTSANPARIVVFGANTVGDVEPVASIVGSNTGLSQPRGLALNPLGRLYVTDAGSASIRFFTNGATGNVPPLGTITGANTGLSGPAGLCFDFRGRLYVANSGNHSVTVYAASATGNASPVDTIGGPNTGLNVPLGVAMDAGGKLFVANSGTGPSTSSITVYESGAHGNVTPIATIMGDSTGLDQPRGVAVDPGGRIFVVNSATLSHQYRITVYAADANGNAAPVATISGNLTGLTAPSYLAF
jgi:sugar lactone lactonase YvrE